MATTRQYAYYLEGNQVAIVEKDVSFDNDVDNKDYGPGASRQRWESPKASITDGLEVKYVYSPKYRVYTSGTVEVDKFYVNGWTVIGGYLTFLRSALTSALHDWTSSPYSAVTSGTSGDTGGQTGLDYIVVEGSSRWSGLHRIQTASADGKLKTYTKVSESLPYWEDQQIDFAIDETIFDGGGNSLRLADYFSAGDYIYISDCSNVVNNGLFSVNSVTQSTTYASSKVELGTKYYSETGGSTSGVLDTEQSVAAGFIADDDESDINVYKCYREFCSIRTDVDVLNDEGDTIDLPSYLNKALVYYVKAKLAEDALNVEAKEYLMREFKKMVEKHENSRISGLRIISSGSHAIR